MKIMKPKLKIVHIVGARPNFMKIAPLMREMAKYPQIQSILVHTGQHYDESMSDIFFTDLKIPRPDINLEVGSGSHAIQTAQVMMHFEPVLLEHRPDLVLVVGDVNSTLACSLVSAKLNIPVAHVEAGIRSFDRSMPEEINRIITDTLSDWLFTPHREASENLLREGASKEKIFFVGNIMIDTLLAAREIAIQRKTWTQWGLSPKGYAVLTLHRPSNVDHLETLKGLLDALRQISTRLPIVFPIHPRTSRRIQEAGLEAEIHSMKGLLLVEPQGYLDFLCLLSQARMVLTDSGSMQAETTMLNVPCLTLRWNTEWPITLSEGTNVLVGNDPEKITFEAERILRGEGNENPRPEFWDGHTADRIVKALLERV
jgi:UDP-N-acetylglucosamine 2-epimerase (non-hydrolysing)